MRYYPASLTDNRPARRQESGAFVPLYVGTLAPLAPLEAIRSIYQWAYEQAQQSLAQKNRKPDLFANMN